MNPVLFVENDDSFSWNVVDALPFERGAVRIEHGADRRAVANALASCGAVVIGPGPTDPERAGLIDLVKAIADRGLPLLGICLGHQAIGMAFGAKLIRTEPRHGKHSTFEMRPSRLFSSVVGPVIGMRYHSLALSEVCPPLRTIAETSDGTVMAVEHETLPIAGLQFHPDSFGTPRGREIVGAFFGAVQ